MQLERKKLRLPRVERTEDVHPEDGENLLWAVSYSDLLMVLMSFFVIFFAANKGKKDAIFQDVSIALNKNVPGAKTLGTGTGSKGGSKAKVPTPISQAEFEAFKQQQIEAELVNEKISSTISDSLRQIGVDVDTTEEPSALTINLPDNIYSSTTFEITPKIQLILDQIFSLILDHKDKINVHFIGHSDSAPIKTSTSVFLTSNYTLSALRAAKALEYSLNLGYPSNQLFAQGGAENMRDSRSLSVRLVMRGAAKLKKDVAH